MRIKNKYSIALHTLGCKLNFAETSTIGRQFFENGFHTVPFTEEAEVYVLNTCTVSHKADRECRQIIRRVLRKRPDAFVIVAGCYAQLRPEEIASIVGVDIVLGTKDKYKIFDLVKNFEKEKYPKIFVSDLNGDDDFGPAFSGDADNRTRAFLKVQDGCDYKCSFCTIPLARGQSRSQSIEISVSQARSLAAKGFKEIVLSGVNVGDYGEKIDMNLFSLLKELVKIEGIERIRISSIEPNLLSHEMIDFIIDNEKLCNHFHIPLQSGANEILQQMRRRYSVQDYQNLIEYIKKNDPTSGIGTDVIVGFPGETDNHFEETYSFLLDLPVSYLHVFTYSERPNTQAIISANVVEPRIRHIRNEKLRLLSSKKKHHFYTQFIGKELPVLYEGTIKDAHIYGWTSNYIRVSVPAISQLENRIIKTRINKCLDEYCEGEIILTTSERIS